MSLYSVYTTTVDLDIDTLGGGYQVIAIDATSGNVNVTFPAYITEGVWLIFRRLDSSANTATLLSSPVDNLPINGTTSYNFPVGSGTTFMSFSSGWMNY